MQNKTPAVGTNHDRGCALPVWPVRLFEAEQQRTRERADIDGTAIFM